MSIPTFRVSSSRCLENNSSTGNLKKWSMRYNNKHILIKTSSYNEYNNNWAYEAYAELISCRLAKEIGIADVVMYYPCKIIIDNSIETIGCYCYSFLKQDEKYISIANCNKNQRLRDYTGQKDNGYRAMIQDIKQVFKLEYRKSLDENILLDFIILNTDRHLGNLGLVVNKQGKVRTAPLFDNGTSLFCNKDTTDFIWTDIIEYARSRPFSMSFDEQLRYIDKTKIEINKDVSKTLKYIDGLTRYKLPKDRAEFIKKLISDRIKLV